MNLSFNEEDNAEWNKLEVKPESLGENWINIAMDKSLKKYTREHIPLFKRIQKEKCKLNFTIGGKIKVIVLMFCTMLLNKFKQLI